MLSTRTSDTHAVASATESIAVYKGLTVAVCTVDKTEVNLTRQDLIELINVCSILPHVGQFVYACERVRVCGM